MFKVWGYKKNGDNLSAFEKVLDEIRIPGCSQCEIYTDSDGTYIAWQCVEKEIGKYDGVLIIASVQDLGEDKAGVLRRLELIRSLKASLVIADYPSTHSYTDPKANRIAIDAVIDVYRSLMDNKTFDIRNAAHERGGRPRVGYPDNWAELFSAWEEGIISSKQFLGKSGLRKGTFYHMVAHYREQIAHMKEIKKIG